MNRPTLRTADLERKLLAAIAEGIPLREYCRRSGLGRATVYDWMKDPDFAARMARARTIGFEALADEIIEIADDSRNDWMEREQTQAAAAEKRPPVKVYNPESVARSRLRIYARLRVLNRWYPRVPGEGPARLAAAEGAAESAQPVDTLAIAMRLSAILSTIADRVEREDAGGAMPDDDGFEDDRDDLG